MTNHLDNNASLIGLHSLWAETLGEPDVCIAVLDGSVDTNHSCFKKANITQIKTIVSDTNYSELASTHGTHIASIIFGQHDSAVKGIAPQCRGLIIPIFANEIEGILVPCSQLNLARAITQAVEQGANVINISGGQISQLGEADHFLEQAVQLCAENNVLIVAAAGNDGCQCLHVPAALPTVLAVGAMDNQGFPLDFSNWGDVYQHQGILAPGEDILGAKPGGGTILRNGTSFATAIVSGIAALLLSLQLKRKNKIDPRNVRNSIIRGATSCNSRINEDCRRFLAGSINLNSTINNLLEDIDNMDELNQNKVLPSEQDSEKEQPVNSGNLTTLNEEAITNDANTLSSINSEFAEMSVVAPSSTSNYVTPSENCDCANPNIDPTQLVYALGSLSYDFGTQARRDAFEQNMGSLTPNQTTDLLTYLNEFPYEAQSIIWTLKLDATPIYAIMPSGAFAQETYNTLRTFLEEQVNQNTEIISVPGAISGSVRLLSGEIVPAITPNLRGLYNWNIQSLTAAAIDSSGEEDTIENLEEGLNNYLNQVYYRFRNLGKTSRERALNFSATNAFSVTSVIAEAGRRSLELDTIEVEPSPICRTGSECFDVKVSFFDPENMMRARRVYRYTVDVSDIIPVTIGEIRVWSER